ncbi:MAG: hypothetical protein BM564_01510 [Bacteroidetes bacterium MedPE-SWsnd-G2]|nr:MAG: hypothetical protein BM564_01510 [Bacteroidetes bacterium MedPE-SWsnd-G2]
MFIPVLGIGQFSERYLELYKTVEKIDSTKISTTFKNGNPKTIGTITDFKYNDQFYSLPTGKYITHFRNGDKQVLQYDSYGNDLIHKYYNKNGLLITEYQYIHTDSNAKHLDELFNGDSDYTVILELRHYKISKIDGTNYLYKKGRFKNGKKIGTWTYYLPDGTIKKEIIKSNQ